MFTLKDKRITKNTGQAVTLPTLFFFLVMVKHILFQLDAKNDYVTVINTITDFNKLYFHSL